MSCLDMHVHSSYSDDGSYTPKELMVMAVQQGIRTIAIADHNTIRAIPEEKIWAKEMNIAFIPAVELDCLYKGVSLHVLGYWIEKKMNIFEELGKDIYIQEKSASKKRIKLVKDMGLLFDVDKVAALSKNGVVTGEIIAEVVLQDKRNLKNSLIIPYLTGGERADNPYVNFYWDYCSQGKPAYTPIEYISLKEAINIIQDAGGITVLAHPGNNIKEEFLLKEIINSGIEGIEAYSSYHNQEQTAFYLKIAKKMNLMVSCGSDFHGKTKPSIQMGSVNCEGRELELIKALQNKRSL